MFKDFRLSSPSNTMIPAKCIMSLHNVKKVMYEKPRKVLTIHYFNETYPETIQCVEETVYHEIIKEIIQNNARNWDGNPNNQF